MSPALTEWIFTIGAGERLAGVAQFSNYPPAARQKPVVGGYINPSFEQMLLLKPDLIVTQGHSEKVTGFCRQRGIPLLALEISDLAHTHQAVRQLGTALGLKAEAERVLRGITDGFSAVRLAAAGKPRKKVFFCIGRNPGSLNGLYTIGANAAYLSELIRMAGGEDIFADVEQGYPQISKEALLTRAPEVIIEPRPGENLTPENMAALKREWQPLSGIPAVQSGQMYFPTEDYLMIPGPRLALAAKKLVELIQQN